MKKIVLEELLAKQKKSEVIREQANLIANELILEFDINEGSRLAFFLTVPQGLDNFMALRVWVERELIKLDNVMDEANLAGLHAVLYEEIRSYFVSKFPESMLVCG